MKKLLLGVLCFGMILVMATGCRNINCVVANADTGIGIKFDYNPTTNLPQGQVAFLHASNIIVPTNRVSDDTAKVATGNGASDSVDVISEISFTSFFAFWNSNPTIYERLAVGKNAVNAPGAVAMMAKSSSGSLTQQAVDAIKAISGVKTTDTALVNDKAVLINICVDPVKKAKAVDMLKSLGSTWDEFIDGSSNITSADVKSIISKL